MKNVDYWCRVQNPLINYVSNIEKNDFDDEFDCFSIRYYYSIAVFYIGLSNHEIIFYDLTGYFLISYL